VRRWEFGVGDWRCTGLDMEFEGLGILLEERKVYG
jgi:hypothetical protein